MTATIGPGIHTLPQRLGAEAVAGSRLRKIWEEEPGIKSFLGTTDHKRIGRRYLVTSGLFFLLAGLMALAMRAQLARPKQGVLSPSEYNQLMTLHGTTMIFFFATPMLFGFGNYLVPLMIGARDMAFPRLNAFGYWVFAGSGVIMVGSLLFGDAPNGGWFAYTPLTSAQHTPGLNNTVYCVALLFLGISTSLGGINFIVTILKMRAPGMALHRYPTFIWAILVISFMVVFALPPLNIANFMLFLDRRFGYHFFASANGGDPLLWQHLFWLFGHPEVYIIALPAFGIISSVIPVFSRRPIAAYPYVVLSEIATGILGFGVWVHHMFATGLPTLDYGFFSAASFIITIPSGIQVFAWIATMMMGRVVLRTPMLFAIGFLINFVIGGVTGVMFADISVDQQLTDSYFVVAHLHYVFFGASVFPMLAGIYYWFPKITGRMLNDRAGKWSFWTIFVGFNLTFFPMHILGMLGMARRQYTYPSNIGYDTINLVQTIGAGILTIGLLLTLLNIFEALRRPQTAPDDPWGGETLEWATSSPPQPYNFPVIPTVHSSHPLWDGESLDSMNTHERDPERVLAEGGKKALVTSELDSRLERPVGMPEETTMPFVMAGALVAVTLGLIDHAYPVSIAGAVIAVAALGRWMWPAKETE